LEHQAWERERELLFVRNEGMENMTIGAKRYGINTIHVTHKTIGSDRPWSLHVRTRRFRATEVLRRPEQIRIQLGWLFVAGII